MRTLEKNKKNEDMSMKEKNMKGEKNCGADDIIKGQ